MKDDYAHALARVLVYEGGFSNNPKDPGGATMKGITQGTYNSWRVRKGQALAPVKSISDLEVADIYKHDYWDRIEADDLPSGVDFCMFDAAVNSGVGGATKWAQAVIGGISVDGDFGPKTKASIIAYDPDRFIHDFCSRRLGSLQRLSTWSTFGKGWSARIANVQKTSVSWEQLVDAPDPVQVHTIGGNAKGRITDIPVSKLSKVTTHAGTLGGVIVTGAAQATQSLTGVGDTFAWVKYAIGGLTVAGAVAGLIVFFSQKANDNATSATRLATVDPDADVDVPSVSVKDAVTVAAPAAAVAETTEKPHG